MGNRRQQHARNVFGSKIAAKRDLLDMLWPTLGATLLFFVPYFLLSEALGLACYGTGTELRKGLTNEQVLSYLLSFEVANLLLIQPLYFGLTQFYAIRRAGGYPRISMVTMCLESPKLYWKSVRMALIILLFSTLWAIPAGLVCLAGYIVYLYILPTNIGWFLFLELAIITGAVYVSILLQYHCGYALLAEQPKMGCWQAVRTAVKTCKGHTKEIFSLLTSFCFWIVITIILNGVPMIAVCPYLILALYHLFDRIRGVQIKLAEPEIK